MIACYDFLRKGLRGNESGNGNKKRVFQTGGKGRPDCNIIVASIPFSRCEDKLIQMATLSPEAEEHHTYSLILLKFCEHRSILLRSMAWFLHHTGFLNAEETAVPMRTCYAQYEECVSQMKKIHSLSLKYSQTGDTAIYLRIIDYLASPVYP